MKSILDTTVSGFANYHTTEPKDVNLLAWLRSEKYKDKVLAIRKLSDKKQRDQIKATLPAITPSGIFSERKGSALITHSGFMQFDIDAVDDIRATKQKVCALQNVAFCGLSVSGRGLWGLIPIAEPAYHKQYFEFIQKAFASMGIIIDESCKDVSRLRGASYDPDAYFNHDARPLSKFYSRLQVNARKTHFKAITGNYETKRIEYCLSELNARKIDLTHHYSNWFALGCSFSSLGEGGRQYFHIASQNYPGYDPHETDEQFTKCLKTSSTKNLATFFAMCRDAGVHFKDAAPIETFQRKQKEPFPKWYLLHAEALKKRMRKEITNSQYCSQMETIAKDAGLSVGDYVSQVNKYDPLYFKNNYHE